MIIDALPTHPVTGLRAIGWTSRGPIWPILGGAPDPEEPDPDADPGNPVEPDKQDPVPPPQAEPDKGEPAPSTFQAITSQDDLDKILGRRLAQERAKYSGYDDLKAKAAEYDKLEDAKKTETQRLTDQLNAANKRAADLELNQLRRDVADAKGLPASLIKRLNGTTREELEADADDLLDTLPKPEPPAPPMQRQPKENLRGGGNPAEEPEETDPRKLAARIPRR